MYHFFSIPSLLRPLQAPDSKSIELCICAENRQIVLDRLRGNHAIERIAMRFLETRGPHHRFRFHSEKIVSKAILDIVDQVALKLNRLGVCRSALSG